MSELLVALRKKTTFECEELHRGFITAMNGLAALAILEEKVCSCCRLEYEMDFDTL